MFERNLRGVTERHRISAEQIRSTEAARLNKKADILTDYFTSPITLTHKGDTIATVHGAYSLLNEALVAGRKGTQISRYKGLGK